MTSSRKKDTRTSDEVKEELMDLRQLLKVHIEGAEDTAAQLIKALEASYLADVDKDVASKVLRKVAKIRILMTCNHF